MKVSISSFGRFYTFDLAAQLEKRGYLSKLYTGYPKWKTDRLPTPKTHTYPWILVPAFILGRLGLQGIQDGLGRFMTVSFDRWVAKHLDQCDVFHSLASFGLYSHRLAKQKFGAITICDRGSSHLRFQQNLLSEEYKRLNLSFKRVDPVIFERELTEYQECDLIFAPSTFVEKSFVEEGIPKEKLVKIPFGVDLDLFRPVPKNDKTFRVIYVGAMSVRKGIPYLLEAYNGAKSRDTELWLIGNLISEMRPFMHQHEENLKHFGILPRSALYEYYSQSSVFVMPSIEDGFGLVMAQAMACGLPIIATENTGGADLFTDGVEGFIVPIRDPEAIREKIQYLYEHPDIRAEMGQAALKRMKSIGGWDVYGDQVVKAYKKALGENLNAQEDL